MTTLIGAKNKSGLNSHVSVPYGDPLAQILLWQKSLLLVPLWAVPIILALGMASQLCNQAVYEFVYASTLCALLLYYMQDLLKRRIRLDQDYIYFGYSSIPIKDVISIDLITKPNHVLPSTLVLLRDSGAQVKLNLSGLSNQNMQAIVSHLQSHNSRIKATPLLNVLIKSGRTVKAPLAVPTRLELSYNAHPLVADTKQIYLDTGQKWMRVGPLIVLVLSVPIWNTMLGGIFGAFGMLNHAYANKMNLQAFLAGWAGAVSHLLDETFRNASHAIANASRNDIILAVIGSLLTILVLAVVRELCKANALIAEEKSFYLGRRLGFFLIPSRKIPWSQVTRVRMADGDDHAPKIILDLLSGEPFKISLSAIGVESRSLLLKRIEQCLPDKPIEHEVAETLLPPSEHSHTELWLQSLTSAPERQVLEPLEPGQTLVDGKYEIDSSLGVGGQGAAYLTRLTASGQKVVLKETILPVFVDDSVRRRALERFEQEAELLKSLEHPQIVKLLHYFIENHRAYLVLELATGKNLRDHVLREGAIDGARVIRLAHQMCDILTYLHGHLIVYRDFTPDNLILDDKDNLKLIDFNVAQRTTGGSQGEIVGKTAYMPPEQFRGKANLQSDIYALGATLHFLLTAVDPEALSSSKPAAVNASISANLSALVTKATALDPKQRFSSIQQLSEALTNIDG